MRFIPLLFSVIVSFAVTPHLSAEKTGDETATKSGSEKSKAVDENWESEKRQSALRVQLFLDAQGFGPGKIDGYWGGFSKKAAERWNEAGKDQKIAILEDGELDTRKVNELPFSKDLIIDYKITDSDSDLLGSLPESPEDQAKLEFLPYTSLMEVIAEKFHADPDFIREINDLETDSDLAVGNVIKVPAVSESFDIAEPMELAKKADEEKESKDEESKSEVAEDVDLQLTVLRDARVVEVRKGGELIHSYPISPGAGDNQSPAGNWEVSIVSWMPEFRWDKSMLESGERSSDAHMLPPGPNNPVGIVWIGLTADGIGLHGTPFPDAIGRNSSHGCIRLANWDALELAKIAVKGTPVIVK